MLIFFSVHKVQLVIDCIVGTGTREHLGTCFSCSQQTKTVSV